MTDNNEPSLDHIPPIVPSRDEVVSRQAAGKRTGRQPAARAASGGGSGGLLTRLFIVVALAVGGVACGWAWQLQQELQQADRLLVQYEARIADLEDRLSDTDEGMNQSSAAMSVKIKELYSEVDKLWASAWRRNKAKIADLEKSSSDHGSRLSTLAKTDQQYSTQLQAIGSDIEKLRSTAADLDRLVSSAGDNQALMENLGDDVSRLSLEISKVQKRLAEDAEWQAAVDGSRRQLNQALMQVQARLAQLEQPGA